MLSDIQLQYVGWACTVVGGFLCGVLAFWLLRPKPKRMLFQVADLPKPVPYASARGSKPPAPWVTREEWLETEVCNSGLRDWQKHVFHELERRVTALENQRPKPAPEPLAPGVRVFDSGLLYVRLWDGSKMWARDVSGEWAIDCREHHNPELFSDTELHGPETLAVYEDWKARKE